MKYILEQYVGNEEDEARAAFKVGMNLYGFCGGIFGRDSYETKIIKEIIHNFLECENIEGQIYHVYVDSWINLLNDSNYGLEQMKKEMERTK